jgi:hypothetical protein
MGIKAEMVPPAIFSSAQRAKREQYKRIFIPWYCYVFSMEHYRGMEEYVKSGGFLVTCSGLSLVDSDGDKRKSKDKGTKFPADTFLGLDASWVFNIKKIKLVDSENVLVEKMELKSDWMQFVVPGRKGRNISADVIIAAEGLIYDKKHKGAFLAVKSYGKGACVFIAAPLSKRKSFEKHPELEKISVNCFLSPAFKDFCIQ